jgi:hypothetical protein
MNSISTPRSGGGQVQAASDPAQGATFTIAQGLLERVVLELDGEVVELVEHISDLMKRMAGLLPDHTGSDARRRLQNPRLRTTYVNERIKALTAKSIDLREELGEKMKEIIEPALKLELVEAELAAAVALRAELDAVRITKEATGLYPAVAAAADYLHQQFGVTHWHWANAGPDRMKLVAKVLRHDEDLVSRDEREAEDLRRILHESS